MSRLDELRFLHTDLLRFDSPVNTARRVYALFGVSKWDGVLVTVDPGACQSLIARRLPHFWIASGLCYLSGHASLGPDYNDPRVPALDAIWPKEPCDSGFHEDIHTGEMDLYADNRHQCCALLRCALSALIFQEERRALN